MRVYNPEKDEALFVHWWMELKADPEEMDKLFLPKLQSLTELLSWAQQTVKIGFDSDNEGISMAAWCEPMMSGAFLGAWVRKDMRHTKRALSFIGSFYEASLMTWPLLIGITKQPALHKLHLKLGYVYGGEIPYLYGGQPARIYYMTRESRERALRRLERPRMLEAS